VAKAIEFKDRFQNMGAQLVRSVASKTNDVAGDGTTTATVLARAIYSEGCKSVAAGLNPMELRKGMQQAVEHIIGHLKGQSINITSSEEIAQVRACMRGRRKALVAALQWSAVGLRVRITRSSLVRARC
jgi:chaperonin GroEL